MGLTALAQDRIRTHFANHSIERGLAVDATCGNGFDTAFLCSLEFKAVIGFDIQARAIKITQHRLETAGFTNARLINESHERVADFIEQPINCAMFNFGYLPHGDKSITTVSESSIHALESVLKGLSLNGIVTLICYPGHPAGHVETEAIRSFLKAKEGDWRIEHHQSPHPGDTAPELFVLTVN